MTWVVEDLASPINTKTLAQFCAGMHQIFYHLLNIAVIWWQMELGTSDENYSQNFFGDGSFITTPAR